MKQFIKFIGIALAFIFAFFAVWYFYQSITGEGVEQIKVQKKTNNQPTRLNKKTQETRVDREVEERKSIQNKQLNYKKRFRRERGDEKAKRPSKEYKQYFKEVLNKGLEKGKYLGKKNGVKFVALENYFSSKEYVSESEFLKLVGKEAGKFIYEYTGEEANKPVDLLDENVYISSFGGPLKYFNGVVNIKLKNMDYRESINEKYPFFEKIDFDHRTRWIDFTLEKNHWSKLENLYEQLSGDQEVESVEIEFDPIPRRPY